MKLLICEKVRQKYTFFLYLWQFLTMKFSFRVILLLCFSLGLLFSASCGRKHGPRGSVPMLKIDSLFVNLSQPALTKRIAATDKAFTEMRKSQGLNGVVLYAEGGQVIYKKAFGWRNLVQQKDSLRIDDQFQLASVSKMFTAEAIMLLYSKGKLNYEDDITKYIPEFPYQGITIRHLLNHRSGLSRYEILADEHWRDRGVPVNNEDVISLYVEHKPAPYNLPDITFHYTNVNYALLASIIERVTKQHFENFMKEQIFKPIGMDHSYIYSMRDVQRLTTYVDTEVQGHDLLKNGARRSQDDYLNGVLGDKMMYSTVEDLYRFNLALEYDLFLPDSIQQEAFKPGSQEWKKGDNYGFGWRMSEKHPGTVFHFGWWKGYRSFFIRDLEKRRVLIVLTNTDSGAVGDSLWDFINDTTGQLPKASCNKNLIFN